jgi:predicted small secreted protein
MEPGMLWRWNAFKATAVVALVACVFTGCETVNGTPKTANSASGHRGILFSRQGAQGLLEAFKAANVKGDGRLTLQEEVNALMKDFEAR